MKAARPFSKWAGGKTQLLPHLLKAFPAECKGTYYEPFVGGGALFWALADAKRIQRAHLNDINQELIQAYSGLCLGAKFVIDRLREMKDEHSIEYFYQQRSIDWTQLSPAAAAARFIYLNKAGFNGLYRVNRSGFFNVPWGYRKKESLLDEENLFACAGLLQSMDGLWSALDFQKAVAQAKKDDWIYIDSPYIPIKPTSHVAYSADRFDEQNQRRLAQVAHELRDRGCFVVASNADMPLARELYADFRIVEVSARRNISQSTAGRAKVGELILIGEAP